MVNGYKKTEIGVVPTEWDVLPFGEVFRTLSNNTLSRDQLNYDSGSIKDIHYGDVLILFPEVLDCSRDDIPYVNNDVSVSGQPLQDGDIIISDTAEDETVGKAVEVFNRGNTNIVAGLHTIPCRVKNGKFASGWLGYFINSHYYHDQLIPYIHGTKVSSIARESLADTYIVVPPYKEQEKIVTSLSDIGEMISESERLIEKYKSMKQSCLQHMFPRKGQTEPEMRLPGFSGAWEQRKLGGLGYTFTGLSGKTKEDFGHGDAHFITYMNVYSNPIADLTMTERVEVDDKQSQVRYGDVFFTTSSETPDEVGMSSVWLGNTENTYLNSFCFGYRPESSIDPYYMAYMLRSEVVRKNIIFLAQGISRYNISKNRMMDIQIPLPDIGEQQRIGSFFYELDHLITLHQRKYEKYKMIKQGMMEDLLTGKVRLK